MDSRSVSTVARRRALAPALVALACLIVGGDPALAAKSKTPVTASLKHLKVPPQELRIRVRALIRPTLGMVEETADRNLREATDPVIRRGITVWKIEATTTLLSAMLRNDPVLALADAWGYAFQVEAALKRPEVAAKYGEYAPEAAACMVSIQEEFRAFAASVQADLTGEKMEATVRQWAERNPIEGALYRRPSVDSAVADILAAASGGGTFSAIAGLEETTSDVMTRMDLYTMYLPRLARWEAELAVDDMARGADPKDLLADIDRLARALDRIAVIFEIAPDVVARERGLALEGVKAERLAMTRDLQEERRLILEAVRQERIATLAEAEAIAQRLVDRSAGPLHEALKADLRDLVARVGLMRKPLFDDASLAANDVVDHAFLRLTELLLIVAILGAAGLYVFGRIRRAG